MNLRQTVQSLEQNNIQIALDIGVHQYCDINSNCPIAVELRKVIHDSGVTLPQLLEGFAASQGTPPEPEAIRLPEFNGKANIRIAGQSIEIDFTDTIKAQLEGAYASRLSSFNQMSSGLVHVGEGLYSTYLGKIEQLMDRKELPQLQFEVRDLIKANCLITTENGNYLFLFPRLYKPQWIVTEGFRYALDTEDIALIKRDICFQFTITKENKIISVLIINQDTGGKLQHYHGNRGDCWGQVELPERWDRRLQSLTDFVTQLIGSLATINKDSLMEHHPREMPEIDEVFGRSTKLGREGYRDEKEESVQPARTGRWGTDRAVPGVPTDVNALNAEDANDFLPAEAIANGDVPTPARWGQRRTTPQTPGDTPDHELTDAEELMRRFNIRVAPDEEDFDMECALCGRTYGEHLGEYTCPRDYVPRGGN